MKKDVWQVQKEERELRETNRRKQAESEPEPTAVSPRDARPAAPRRSGGASIGPDVEPVQDPAISPRPPASLLEKVADFWGRQAVDWLEEERPPERVIETEIANPYYDPTLGNSPTIPRWRSGYDDPVTWGRQQAGRVDFEPEPPLSRMLGLGAASPLGEHIREEVADQGVTESDIVDLGPLSTGATITNDLFTRLANLRSNIADNPDDASDDDAISVTTSQGNTYVKGREPREGEDVDEGEAGQWEAWYKLKDGTIIEKKEYEQAIEQPSDWVLGDGSLISNDLLMMPAENRVYPPDLKDWVEISDPNDPRVAGGFAAESGRGTWLYPTWQILDGIQRTSTDALMQARPAAYKTQSGQVIEADAIPEAGEWGDAFYQYRYPDGTVAMEADGTIPKETRDLPEEQTTGRGPLNLGIADPRAPWQDDAGNNIWQALPWVEGDFDFSRSAADEVLPWLIDMNLSSAPYYHPKLRYPAAAARIVPYLQGLDGASYRPEGGLENVGNGTYSQEVLSRAQTAGGVAAPITDAVFERIGGRAIGIEPGGWLARKLPSSIQRALMKPGWSTVISALVEGGEEVGSNIPQNVTQDGIRMYGRPKYYNEETGEWEYDMDAPGGLFSPTSRESVYQDFGAGATLGGMMTGGNVSARTAWDKVTGRYNPVHPVSPSGLDRYDHPDPELPATLRRGFGEEDE